MAVYTHDDILAGGVDLLVSDATAIHLMDTFETVYATILTNSFGTFTPTIAKADDGAGQVARLTAETGVAITADGTLNHYAIVNTTGTKVLCVSEADGKVFNNGDTVDIATADVYQVRDTIIAP
jgi:hypothetical protein